MLLDEVLDVESIKVDGELGPRAEMPVGVG